MNLFIRLKIFFEKTNKFNLSKVLPKIKVELGSFSKIDIIDSHKLKFLYNNFVYLLFLKFSNYKEEEIFFLEKKLLSIRGVKYVKTDYISES